MSSPFWTHGGTRNGRIAPNWAEAQGAVSIIYYGGTYYYSYGYISYVSGYQFDYSAESDHVFVLGEDLGHTPNVRYNRLLGYFPEYRFVTDEVSYVEQTVADLTDIDILYFTWRLNTSPSMPHAARSLSAATIEIKDGGIAAYGDGARGIILPKDFTSGFEDYDQDRVVTLAGTASNDGTHRISVVPKNTDGLGGGDFPPGRVAAAPDTARHIGPGDADPAPDPDQVKQYKNGQVAIFENASGITAEVAVGATVTIPGWRWVAKAYVDDILRTELRETRAGRWWQRNYMAAHVGKLTGVHTLKFELSLEQITS